MAGDPNSDDYYKVLGVQRDASEKDIATAYKKAAIKWHPDKNPTNKDKAEANFKKVSEAYEVLSNAEKKEVYDRVGKAGLEGGGGGGPGGFPGGMGGGRGMSFSEAEMMFQSFFGGQDPFSMFEGHPGMGRGRRGSGGGPQIFFDGMGGGGPFGGMGGMGGMGGPFGGMHGMGGRGGAQMPKQQYPNRPDVIPQGTPVILRGLQSAAAQNGKTGTIKDYDVHKERYQVKLSDSDTLAVKIANVLQQVQVQITGVESKPEFNGNKGKVIGFDESSNRYQVQLADGRAIALQSVNLVFSENTRVQIQGLSKQELNGKWGKIASFEDAAGRYVVEISRDQSFKLKPENCRL
ncbi:hypothetical protein CYMTET_42216 [Cymbomonas tetramitiformis]|uniref:J domain-containing protein n=1 Tax=Cymbomonas tetramitiformis TaxID=36881 RepID=A0AAE0C697_9CHLO|nr:hypothetical protein CYMTET_42216 [Cymbomonas tetramitiformis]